ncbi:MAG TPA: hypothetical protein VMU50_08175 [Polyangia bacterium]|nr:hypothetical protein [Polyangia bacterium]
MNRQTIILVALLGTLRCSWLLNPSAQQCAVDSDCQLYASQLGGAACIDNLCVAPPLDAGVEAPTGWECVGNNTPVTPNKPLVQLTVTVGDLIHPEMPVSDFVVLKACHKLDVTCSMPIMDNVRPDAAGHATFTVEGGFDGYVEADPAPTLKQPVYVPTLIFISLPLVDDTMNPPTLLISIADLAALAPQAGGTIDSTLGGIIYRAADCTHTPAPGIVAALDHDGPDTKHFFFVHGLPTQTANSTDASGLGGFINVPVGVRSVTGKRAADDQFIATFSVLVRPSFFSYSLLAPQPL